MGMAKEEAGMNKFYGGLPQEAKAMYDGVHALVKICGIGRMRRL